VRVAGGLKFQRVNAGPIHTCAVTIDNKGYCWGYNTGGQLGDGTTTWRSKPAAVAGGLKFRQIVPGADHTCGVTTDDRAYCWGGNEFGQLGASGSHPTPAAVSGNKRFRQVVAGLYHTCGVTLSEVAFCWGYNGYGENGDGSVIDSRSPVMVAGGHHFEGISTGSQEASPFSDGQAHHTCGLTPDNRVYCWGYNLYGQVGDGTGGPGSRRLTPVAVVGPQ
jgi:alpha-tubulin suppressor-like RCC1 family protein